MTTPNDPDPDATGPATPGPCQTCADLNQRASDPQNETRGAALACLITHHLDAHGLTPEPLPNCPRCSELWDPDIRLPAEFLAYLQGQHYGRHVLDPLHGTRRRTPR
ncbi:hypothetical protein ACWC9H_27330 [Streptomyces sp. NPDC001251]